MKNFNQKPLLIFILLSLFFVVTSCRKDISVPNPELEKLFTTWDWVKSTGGISGAGETPESTGCSIQIEYNKNGIFKLYKDNVQASKFKFTLSEGPSLYGSETVYIITYDNLKESLESSPGPNDEIEFRGKDTLILNDQAADGYKGFYVRHE
jgi:hypothetical protein